MTRRDVRCVRSAVVPEPSHREPEPTAAPPAAEPLAGRVALVTGGTRGIGRAISLDLARAGATVVAAYRGDAEAAARLAAEALAGTGRVATWSGDLRAAGVCERLVAHVVGTHGGIDVLVNNAGITADRTALRMSDADWDAVVDVNLSAAFRLARAALAHMVPAGAGRIVNIASLAGERGNIGQANYAAAKAGLLGLTKTLARETAAAVTRGDRSPDPRGLTVNAVSPGWTATEMLASVPAGLLERVLLEIPVGRLARPAEIGRVVRFLCEDASAYITGQTWHVDGGMTM
jgi:acetoacetyl-CoA reductase/3-oxoacyl-[acyl-carrier protein] reductase